MSGDGLVHIILSFIGVFICLDSGPFLQIRVPSNFALPFVLKVNFSAHEKINNVKSLDP
jgi:hypothetical protein